MNSQYSLCDVHRQEVKYFCAAEACYYLPLCDECCNEHRSVHSSLELIPLKKALLMADSNLRRQENEVQKYLNPLRTKESMITTIAKQKQELQNEKERLIRMIVEKIDSQIKILETSNDTEFTREEGNTKKSLQFKLQEIYSMGSPHFDGKISTLRKALNFETERFMEETISKQSQPAQKNSIVSNRTNKFKVYQSTHHEIMISPLDLREKAHEKTRQIKRVMNQSPLYFLIDQNLSTSPLLYSLSPEQKKLFVYNINHDDWTTVHIGTELMRQGAAVHDYKKNRFFWIGGLTTEEERERPESMYGSSISRGSRSLASQNYRSSKIFIYEPNREPNWRFLTLKYPRSSCQAVLVEDKDDPENYGILIAGGIGANGEVLKSTEYLDLKTQIITLLPDTNFGAYSGTLVTFNKSNVIRIGGLYKNKADIAVVQTVQRIDLSDWLKNPTQDNWPRWRYVELMVPEFDRTEQVTLFNANQAAIQINPNEIFVFGGITSGLKGVADSFILGVEEFEIESRNINFERKAVNSGLREGKMIKQFKFTVRWVNEKPLISGDDFGYQCGSLWKGKLHILQNMGTQDLMTFQKRLLCFNMYEWSEIEDVLPE